MSFRPNVETEHRGELFLSEPLRIFVNHYGAHGHSDNHMDGRMPIKLRCDEESQPGPVRVLMRDGRRLPEPELVDPRILRNKLS